MFSTDREPNRDILQERDGPTPEKEGGGVDPAPTSSQPFSQPQEPFPNQPRL